jgi:HAT1-interacting factor 1
MLKGILGQIIGQSPSEKQSLIDAATKNATDLSAFVKRKPAASKSSQQTSSAPKRSAQERVQEGDSKKARVDDGEEASND